MKDLFTLKTLFLTTVFMLFCCLSIQAADDELITKQVTVKLDKAGTLPDKIGSTKKYKISYCKGLTGITIPSSVTSIGGGAFSGCSGLTSLSIHSGVTSIGGHAFYNCSGLTSIYVYAEKMPKLGANMFDGCDAKNCKVYVPKGTYDDYWLSEFGYFENIEEFDVTGIDNVTTASDAKEVSRYSVNGQRLSAPAKGLNIVKYSDGSVKKVVVQ